MRKYFRVDSGETDVLAIVSMVCVGAVSLIIGFILLNSMDLTVTPVMATSVLSTSKATILGSVGEAYQYLAIGLFVLAAVMIVGIAAGMLGKGED